MRLLLLASFCLLDSSRSTHFLIETVDFSEDTDDTEHISKEPDNFSGNNEVVVKESGTDYGEDTTKEEEHNAVINDNTGKKDSIDFHPHHFKKKSISIYNKTVSPILNENSSDKSSDSLIPPIENGNDYTSESKVDDYKRDTKGKNYKEGTKDTRRKGGDDYMGGLEVPWRNNMHNFELIEEAQQYRDNMIDWRH